jgi:hypothetical protein
MLQALRLSLFALTALALSADRAWALGEILGQSKEELKLKYDVSVTDHGTGRVTIVFTLADAGRLKPLTAVDFAIPAEKKNADGGRWMDLVVAIDMRKTADGKRVGRVHIRREWAERGQIRLLTSSLDGKQTPLTHYLFLIPIAEHMQNAPKAKVKKKAAPAGAAAPAATERKKQ